MTEPPLLVISSDMNHYASDAETRRLDEMALTAMQTPASHRSPAPQSLVTSQLPFGE